MKHLISVIVPIYNVERYLTKCLDSITNQTYRNLEIILVDDGSPDGCPAICDDWAEKDSRIRVIHRENGGVSAARNSGLDVMSGDYLMFVDSDDWLPLDAIQRLYERLIRDGSDMAVGQCTKIYDDGHTEKVQRNWTCDTVITGQEAIAMLGTKAEMPCYACGKLLKKKLYDHIRFTSLKRGEDLLVLPQILDACSTISLETQCVYYYYQRTNSIMHTYRDPQWLDSTRVSFQTATFLLQRGLWDNAAVFCFAGMTTLLQVHDRKQARALLNGAFTKEVWRRLTKHSAKCRLYRIGLYAPGVFRTAQKLWRKLRCKEC